MHLLAAVQLYFLMLLGIHSHIMCLTLSTWKVQLDKMAKHGRDDTMLPSTSSIHRSVSEVNRSGADVQVVSCHRYLVFHPFKLFEQLASHLLYQL